MYRVELPAVGQIVHHRNCVGLKPCIAGVDRFFFDIDTSDMEAGLTVADGGQTCAGV